MCLLTFQYVSNLDLLMYRMNGTCYCGCMGHRCHYRRREKRPTVGLASHVEWFEAFIHGTLEDIPNDCLMFGSNQTLFFSRPSWVTHCGITGLESFTLSLEYSVSSMGVACVTGNLWEEPSKASGPSSTCGPLRSTSCP